MKRQAVVVEQCPTCESDGPEKLRVTSPARTLRRCRDEWHHKAWDVVPNRAEQRAARRRALRSLLPGGDRTPARRARNRVARRSRRINRLRGAQ